LASASHVYDVSGTYNVRARVWDKDGGYTDYQKSVTVVNYPPVSTGLMSSGDVAEGGTVTFTFGPVTDSQADLDAALTYSLDFDGDGVYEVSGSSPAVTHVFDDNGAYTVGARVSDKDGGSSSYSSLVTVHNVAPHHGVLLDNNVIKEGSAVTVWFEGQDDPSHADTVAGFTYSYDFNGDGVYEVSGTASSAMHVFGDNGVYVVHGRVTDKDGGYTEYTTDVEVANVAPTARGLSASGNLVEGNYVTVRLDGATDPS